MIQKLPKEVTKYCDEIKKYPLLSREEEHELAILARDGNQIAINKLATSNLRFVVKQAYKFIGYTKSSKITFQDLIQEGNEGLLVAIRKFDPDRNIRLISYAVWWIRMRMQSFVLKNFSLVKLGTTNQQRSLFNKMADIMELCTEYDPDRKTELRNKLMQETGFSEKYIREMEDRLFNRDLSVYEKAYFNDEYLTILDTLKEPVSWQEHLENANEVVSNYQCLNKAISILPAKQAYVIQRKFSAENPSLKQIGQEIGLCRERVRQIQIQALKQIKKEISSELVNN